MSMSELEMMVAQNCPGYNARLSISMATLGDFAESCSSCSNFVKGICTKELFEEIRDRIRIN